MHEVLDFFYQTAFWRVILAYVGIYVTLVTFAIFGTGILAVLSTPVFGPIAGFAILHVCSITGACSCYFISNRLGAGVVQEQFPDKFAWF